MIEMSAYILLALKTLEENLITFHLGVWKLDGYLPACPGVGGTVNRGHVAAGNDAVNAVVIELVAGINMESSFAGWPYSYFRLDAASLAFKKCRVATGGVATMKLDLWGGAFVPGGSALAAKDALLLMAGKFGSGLNSSSSISC